MTKATRPRSSASANALCIQPNRPVEASPVIGFSEASSWRAQARPDDVYRYNPTTSHYILQDVEVTLSGHRDPPAFAADRMVGRLARWLRLLGADVTYDRELGGGSLLRRAREQGRIVLTRDKRLRTAPDVLLIESNGFREQLREVSARFPFDTRCNAFTRCIRCNVLLTPADKTVVARRVAPFVYASVEKFAQCGKCGRVYWAATHLERAIRELEAIGIGGRGK